MSVNERIQTVTITREQHEELITESRRYRILYDELIAHGCPLKQGCHLPTTVKRWLDELVEGKAR